MNPVKPVLVLAPHYLGIGGAQRYTRQFSRALAASLGRDRVIVWSYLSGSVENGAGPRYLGAAARRSGPWGKVRFALSAARLARRAGLIVAAHVSVAPTAQWFGRIYRVPYVVCGYGIEVWGAIPSARRAALRAAQRVVTISRFTAARLQEDQGVARERIVVIPPVVEPMLQARSDDPAPRPAGRVPHLLTVARLSSAEGYKGCDTVLRALAGLRQGQRTARYTIVGDGDDRSRLQKLARELGVDGLTQFPGAVPDDELARYYETSDLLVMPSRSGYENGRWRGEGFGIVYIEAAAFGVPSIAGRGDGGEEAVEHGVTGLVVDGSDVAAVGGALRTMLDDDASRRRMGQAARDRVRRDFIFVRMEGQVRDLVGSLAGITT